jgi:hypothetical protein
VPSWCNNWHKYIKCLKSEGPYIQGCYGTAGRLHSSYRRFGGAYKVIGSEMRHVLRIVLIRFFIFKLRIDISDTSLNYLYTLVSIFYHSLGSIILIDVHMVLFLFNNVIYVFLLLWLCILMVCLCMATMTKVFPCFSLSCKANARVKPTKTGHGPHSS